MKSLIAAVSLLCIAGVLGQNCDKQTGKDCPKFNQDKDWSTAKSIYEFTAKDIHGKEVLLDKYKGQVAIIVNVASHCGLTETNYQQLQSLYEKYGDRGLKILAFPSNEFNGQEPGTSEEILEFVKKYNVTFDMYEKILVNGDDAHPLYKWLKSQEEGAGTITDGIKWNFTKFIIDRNGKVVSRFAPTTEPFSMEDTLKKYL